jgi:hypothetical protein
VSVSEDGIEQRIDAALAQRRLLHPVVKELARSLSTVEDEFSTLTRQLDTVATAAAVDAGVSAAIEALLADPATGRARAATLRARIDEVRAAVAVVSKRVHRDTLNLGVIGLTKHGKSTLLRSITGLHEDIIPTSKIKSTTAAVSRIYHRAGPASAQVDLHDWAGFRDSYLAPLFRLAKENGGQPPRTVEEFAAYTYKAETNLDDRDVEAERFRKKLRIASASLPSYRSLLSGRGGQPVDIANLRPYVAYPQGDRPDTACPYHAVKEVRIWTEFLTGSTRIGLVDLPGPGESGLVDRHFVRDLTNDVDLFIMIKKPDTTNAAVTDPDWTPLEQAREAAGGVPLRDLVFCVVNDHVGVDGDHSYFDAACADLETEIGNKWKISWVGVDVKDPDAVREKVMTAVLTHLAERIADMDTAALHDTRRQVTELTADVTAFAMQIAAATDRLLLDLPDEQDLLEQRANALRRQVGANMKKLAARYRAEAKTDPDPELTKTATAVAQNVGDWIDSRLGRPADGQWDEVRDALMVELGTIVDTEYARVREKFITEYRRIDGSTERAIARLHDDVADVLRISLTDTLVPGEPAALDHLRREATRLQAATLAGELTFVLDGLSRSYGSILLRVIGPIIQQIRPWSGPDGVDSFDEPDDARDLRKRDPFTPRDTGPATAAPVGTGGAGPAGRRLRPTRDRVPGSMEELRSQLTESAQVVAARLDKALRAEAIAVTGVLAAAVMSMGDRMTEATHTREYVKLCGPHRHAIWPDDFSGGTALLSTELDRTGAAARALMQSLLAVPTGW